MSANQYFKLSPMVFALTLLVCLLGFSITNQLPNSLLPPMDRPEIRVTTVWPGKSAEQIAKTLIAPLEKSLSGIANKSLIKSSIKNNRASVTLQFKQGTDMQQAYMQVLSGISQVPGWPQEVPVPTVVNNSSGAGEMLATMMMHSTNPVSNEQLAHTFETYVRHELLKITGVASLLTSYNPPDKRLDISLDMTRLAEMNIPLAKVIEPLGRLVDNSGGNLIAGDRDYAFHFKGQLESEELLQLPVFQHKTQTILLGDIATINNRLSHDWLYAAIQGERAFYVQIFPTNQANVLATLESIKDKITELNQGVLAQENFIITLSKDDSKAIKAAISQVYIALLLGVILSSCVLFYFIREGKTVALIFVSVPVCLATVLLMMKLFGFSLNVISLAGMALSVGLILDAAIVVIESIQRQMKSSLNIANAIMKGISGVKNAVISSTLSSIVIFIPILLMESPESQLFHDLAFTISTALMASLVCALVILPMIARYLIGKNDQDTEQNNSLKSQTNNNEQGFSRTLCWPMNKSWLAVLILTLALPIALLVTMQMMPEKELMPQPKQKLVQSNIYLSEPLSAKAVEHNIVQPILARLQQQKANPLAPDYDVTGIMCNKRYCYLYFYPPKDWDYAYFEQWLTQNITHDLAGTRVHTIHASLLSLALPNSRVSQLDIQGDNIANLQKAGEKILSHLQDSFPDANINSTTPLSNNTTRIEFTPKYQVLLRYGLSHNFLSQHLQTLTQGLYLGRSFAKGEDLPFYLKSQESNDLDNLLNSQIYVPELGVRSLSELVSASFQQAPASLLRINQQDTLSLNLSPPEGQTVGAFSKQVQESLQPLLAQQQFQDLVISFRGSADKLENFLKEFSDMFIFSILILIALLWVSLKSCRLTLAVIASMPLTLFGGMLALVLLNKYTGQSLDVITMIGFIILMGLVINNAILLCSHYQDSLNNGMNKKQAIFESIDTRKRAIYMSTGTSIFGMLPLLLSPSDGAEIYRGLAAVIIGGMIMSALFSMSFMAALLSLPFFSGRAQSSEKLSNNLLASSLDAHNKVA